MTTYSYSLALSRKGKLEGRKETSPAVMTKQHNLSPSPPPNFHKTATSKPKTQPALDIKQDTVACGHMVSYTQAQPKAVIVMRP